jgi:hypothetical protein
MPDRAAFVEVALAEGAFVETALAEAALLVAALRLLALLALPLLAAQPARVNARHPMTASQGRFNNSSTR